MKKAGKRSGCQASVPQSTCYIYKELERGTISMSCMTDVCQGKSPVFDFTRHDMKEAVMDQLMCDCTRKVVTLCAAVTQNLIPVAVTFHLDIDHTMFF